MKRNERIDLMETLCGFYCCYFLLFFGIWICTALGVKVSETDSFLEVILTVPLWLFAGLCLYSLLGIWMAGYQEAKKYLEKECEKWPWSLNKLLAIGIGFMLSLTHLLFLFEGANWMGFTFGE